MINKKWIYNNTNRDDKQNEYLIINKTNNDHKQNEYMKQIVMINKMNIW